MFQKFCWRSQVASFTWSNGRTATVSSFEFISKKKLSFLFITFFFGGGRLTFVRPLEDERWPFFLFYFIFWCIGHRSFRKTHKKQTTTDESRFILFEKRKTIFVRAQRDDTVAAFQGEKTPTNTKNFARFTSKLLISHLVSILLEIT